MHESKPFKCRERTGNLLLTLGWLNLAISPREGRALVGRLASCEFGLARSLEVDFNNKERPNSDCQGREAGGHFLETVDRVWFGSAW